MKSTLLYGLWDKPIEPLQFNFPLQPVEPLPNFVIRIGIQAGLFEEIARAMCKVTPGLSPVLLLASLARFLK